MTLIFMNGVRMNGIFTDGTLMNGKMIDGIMINGIMMDGIALWYGGGRERRKERQIIECGKRSKI